MNEVRSALRDRFGKEWTRLADRGLDLHQRYSRLFWSLHSAWALLTGAAVLVLAHNRYGYLPWVILFLTLTWASTLFFSRFAKGTDSRALRLAQGFVSYLTRVMYQETLFFLIPFYFYSTTFPSWNCVYVVMLAALALLSCFDIVFDRLLREHRAFALGFFAVVSFSALQFFIPLVLGVPIANGAYLAGLLAFAAAVPLAYSLHDLRDRRRLVRLALALLLALSLVRVLRPVVPPVPLRMTEVDFAAGIDPRTMQLERELAKTAAASELTQGRLFVRATMFSPSRLHTVVKVRFLADGRTVRWSRTLEVRPHAKGFRIWDALRAGPRGFPPGLYQAEVWTDDGQLVGRGSIRLTGAS